jgi:hypothetical protein
MRSGHENCVNLPKITRDGRIRLRARVLRPRMRRIRLCATNRWGFVLELLHGMPPFFMLGGRLLPPWLRAIQFVYLTPEVKDTDDRTVHLQIIGEISLQCPSCREIG